MWLELIMELRNLKANQYSFNNLNVRIAFVLFFFFTYVGCSIKSKVEANQKIDSDFQEFVLKSKNIRSATILIQSKSLDLQYTNSYNILLDVEGNKQLIPNKEPINKPYHIASIGKIFTSVLILKLVEDKKLNLNDKLYRILGEDVLKNLFVYEEKDYSRDVTILQLLNHTSGVDDYFGSFDKESTGLLKEILENPNHFFTPKELVDYTRLNQKAKGKPGEKFHYSDTGYILLGMVTEKITGISWEDQLKNTIFKPLGMINSYVHLRSKPIQDNDSTLSSIILGNVDLTHANSVSGDWAGGGIISTPRDLYTFHEAFVSGKILPKEIYESMKGNNIFHDGIFYGLGLMTLDFGAMSFFMPKMPILYGHSGILGTHLFYSPDLDTHIVLNIGSTDDMESSFEFVFYLLRTIDSYSKSLKEK